MTDLYLITIDALRADVVNKTVNGKRVMPFLSGKMAEGVSYKQAVATGSGTSTSFPAILAGVYPFDHGYPGLTDDHTPLAEWLQNSGVTTVGYSGNVATSSYYGYDRGFDTFEDVVDSGLKRRVMLKRRVINQVMATPIVNDVARASAQLLRNVRSHLSDDDEDDEMPYIRADEMTDNALDAARRNELAGDQFVWLHYMDVHAPYGPPSDLVERFCDRTASEVNELFISWRSNRPDLYGGDQTALSDDDLEAIWQYYMAEAAFVDREIERLYTELDHQGKLEDSVFIVCADHGEEYGEHGNFAHRPKMYDELLRVPLFLFGGTERLSQQTIDTPTSLVDIPPTVADIFGLDPCPEWRGVSLLSDADPRDYTISELSHRSRLGDGVNPDEAIIAVRTGEYKYIHNNQNGEHQLFNLIKDPGETENIIESSPPELDWLKARAEDRLSVGRADGTVQESSVSEDVESRLADLGYVE